MTSTGLKRADAIALLVGVVLAVAFGLRFRNDPLEAVTLAVTAATSARLSQIDFRDHRLPNRIVGPLALFVSLAVLILGAVDGDLERSGRALLTGAAVFVALFALGLVNGIGMGDVKFSFPLVALLAWLGTDYLLLGAMVMILTSGVYTVGVMARKRSLRFLVPFGPFMTIGFVVSALTLG